MERTSFKDCTIKELPIIDKDKIVYRQGDLAQRFFFLEEGIVGLYHILENGKESLMRVYKNGDYFGFRALYGSKEYHCSAKALSPVKVISVIPEKIEDFIISNPEIGNILLMQLADELQEAEYRLAKTAHQKSLDRVIESICYLTENFPDHQWTYREVAEYAGCQTETAIRISKELKKQHILEDNCRHIRLSQ